MMKVWQAGGFTPLLAQTVIGPYMPAALAAPATLPALFIVSPGGSEPLVTEKVGVGFCGDELNWWRYRLPTTPGNGGALVMTGTVWAPAPGARPTDHSPKRAMTPTSTRRLP